MNNVEEISINISSENKSLEPDLIINNINNSIVSKIHTECAAITVENADKTYNDGLLVLKNFNMTVPAGSIYGLIGASGVGKTTVLSCIVGTKKLDAGNVRVFGHPPGTPQSGIPGRLVGYMPQDLALYTQLSIKEVLEYFGRIYGMTQAEITARVEFLSNFLDMPSSNRIVGTLSGGQQRRTSLATCLLHEPSLLILDEPTVGLDPLLRERIWQYLFDLVAKKRTTVLITTHYLEEAKNLHTVGIMRSGRMLVEECPQALLKKHNTTLLDDILLKLCKKDELAFAEMEHSKNSKNLENFKNFENAKKSMNKNAVQKSPDLEEEDGVVGLTFRNRTKSIDVQFNMPIKQFIHDPSQPCLLVKGKDKLGLRIWKTANRIQALVVRNAKILMRNPALIYIMFLLPAFQIIMVNLTIGPEPKHIKFGIVNPEMMNDISLCKDVPIDGCTMEGLSCRFLNNLPNEVLTLVSTNSTEDGVAAIKRGELWGYMEFAANYSQHMADLAISGNFVQNDTLEGTTVNIKMDMSNFFTSLTMRRTIYESFQVFAKGILNACGDDPRKADLPLNYRKPVYGTVNTTYQEYISLGVMCVVLFFIPYMSCAVSCISDRREGTLDRSMVAGVKTSDIVVSYLITEGFGIFIQNLLAYFIVVFVFQTDIKGSSIAYFTLTMLTGIAGLSFGFLMGQICEKELEAFIVGCGWYMPNILLSGTVFPLDGLSPYLQLFCHCLPCTWGISAIRSITIRGWPVTHPYVWPGFAVLILWISFTWILAVWARRSRAKNC